uniref:Cytolytic toxin Cyt1 n=1 Tax=Bacillus thuringiensis TaxID=1428 RepID=Q2PTA3_BACTU|nr:cytolytic toxin Cyt1 [Bacillus thuringiensis]
MENLNHCPLEDIKVNPWKTPQSKARVITLRVEDPNEINNLLSINEIDNPNYILQAIMLANAFQNALVPTSTDFGDALRFSMPKGLEIANTITPMGAVVSYVDQNVTQTNNQVSVMINKVLEVLKTVLGVALSGSVIDQLTAAVTNTFTNLNTQKNEAWIFWGKETANQTNYTYNVLFAIQNAQTGGVMYCVPVGFEIKVSAVKEQVLFFTIQDSASYNVNIQSLKFAQPLVSSSQYPIADLTSAINGTL